MQAGPIKQEEPLGFSIVLLGAVCFFLCWADKEKNERKGE
jgi:hypothetical protein